MMKKLIALIPALFACFLISYAQPVIYCNQVGFDSTSPKIAVIGVDKPLAGQAAFTVKSVGSADVVFSGYLGKPQRVNDWATGKTYYQADFSSLHKPSNYYLRVTIDRET